MKKKIRITSYLKGETNVVFEKRGLKEEVSRTRITRHRHIIQRANRNRNAIQDGQRRTKGPVRVMVTVPFSVAIQHSH